MKVYKKEDIITNARVDQTLWSQRATLAPPPYEGPYKEMLKGLEIGDPRVDKLPVTLLCTHGGEANLEQDPDPEWVDWNLIQRGQQLWSENLGRYHFALTGSLLSGFSIARFAEILYANGYAQSPHTAYTRYSQTGFYILDWLRFPLSDPNGLSRKAIYNVRAMHAFVRRRAIQQKLFDREKGEGIPLSQYDMGEVQIAFSCGALSLMEEEMGLENKFTKEDKEAMIHVWRLIGYHLGIMDEFNICTSYEKNKELFEDWMKWTPHRFVTSRPSTFALQKSAIEGFGQYAGMGEEIWIGVVHKGSKSRFWDVEYLEIRKPLPGIMEFIDASTKVFGHDWVNALTNLQVTSHREGYRNYPQFMKKMESLVKMLSKINDLFLWRIVGMMFFVRAYVAQIPSQYKMLTGMILSYFAMKRMRLL